MISIFFNDIAQPFLLVIFLPSLGLQSERNLKSDSLLNWYRVSVSLGPGVPARHSRSTPLGQFQNILSIGRGNHGHQMFAYRWKVTNSENRTGNGVQSELFLMVTQVNRNLPNINE